MPSLTQKHEVLFPVKMVPVYTKLSTAGSRTGSLIRIPGKRTIVNLRTGTPVSIVGSGYRLVTNEEALDAAYECCSAVFPETHQSEWDLGPVFAPSTGSYCHIDLIHSTAALQFDFLMEGSRPEVPNTFGPFIRVTNSYNSMRALSFSVGFMQKTCSNGLVGPSKIIRFKFDHTRKSLQAGLKFTIKHRQLKKMKKRFLDSFQVLHEYPVDPHLFSPLVIAVLKIKKPNLPDSRNATKRQKKESEVWAVLESHIKRLSERYAHEQGANAYAVLNTMTDLSSNPPVNKFLRRDRHSMQKLAGEWMADFRKSSRKPNFEINEYLPKSDSS
ncbi:MAG: DUF932 domain-containing protein [Rhodobacteraceae bacterium]|nr:DUF932 domain-containing protein [Paracoccaceae bacterium]